MLHTFWSVKGGSGVTVTAAMYAGWIARRDGPTTVVDLCGDQPAALGIAEPNGAGWSDWLATPDGSRAALDRLVVPVHGRLSLLPRGSASAWPLARIPDLVDAFLARTRVVVDAGTIERRSGAGVAGPGDDRSGLLDALGEAGRTTLVLRPCYLAMRRATAVAAQVDDLVVVNEPGRSLTPRDVAEVLGIRLLATFELDPAVARSVDAGLLVRRTNRAIERTLRTAS